MPSVRLDRAFHGLCTCSDDELDLGLGALLLARFDYPTLDPVRWMDRLDDVAADAPTEAMGDVQALTHYLYDDFGLRGNRLDYNDIRNSYLHEVLERKLGIPISLATIVIEVGERLGHDLHGVGFPGHFLLEAVPGELYLDPFDGGRSMDRSDCLALFEQTAQGKARFDDRFLEPVSSRQMLVRMLNNMVALSIRDREPERVRFCFDSIVLLVPEDPAAHLQRGKYLFEVGDVEDAIPDFRSYLDLSPQGAPRRAVEDALREAVRRGTTIN